MRRLLLIILSLFALAGLKNRRGNPIVGLLIGILVIALLLLLAPFIIGVIVFILIAVTIAGLFGVKTKTYTFKSSDFKNYGFNNYNNYNYRYNYSTNNNGFFSEQEFEKACETLGGNKNDSYEDLKKKRNSMIKKYHPDLFVDEKEKEHANEITNKINSAWDTIEKHFNK